MKLLYHQGNNFGDCLNPYIFNKLLPGFFDNDSKIEFLGIGSILGLKRPSDDTEKFIVFSSGYADGAKSTYGYLPDNKMLKNYEFHCVRGPLTANLLNLPKKLAVCDGAILVSHVADLSNKHIKHKYSFMPHVGTLNYYAKWEVFLRDIGINFINPKDNIESIIDEIYNSEILLSEAMHGAIVADALRVPWIPIRTKKTINRFKWLDYCKSLDIHYEPTNVPTLMDDNFLRIVIKNRLPHRYGYFTYGLPKIYAAYQSLFIEKKVKKIFEQLKYKTPVLSKDKNLKIREEQLLNILKNIRLKYSII